VTDDDLPLAELSGGLPPLVTSSAGVEALAASITSGSGPIAVDAERASAYRYGQRAYLVQVHRQGAGTWLIDPIALSEGDREIVGSSLRGEWVLHSALQDLPCLAELGWRPDAVFDTEVAARLLGRERVGLAALVEADLGVRLEKGFGAADWSSRPLPEEWLRYAALDVELLLPLQGLQADELRARGRWEWAGQEFTAIRDAPPPAPRAEPWRRTSGIHRVRGRRGLAIVRALWTARDGVAAHIDVSPGRVLSDATIVDVANAPPQALQGLRGLPGMRARHARDHLTTWWAAIDAAQTLPDAALPSAKADGDGLPHPRQWPARRPEAAERLERYRTAVSTLAAGLGIAVDAVIPPEALRRAAWTGGDPGPSLLENRARPWQVELCLPVLAQQPLQSPDD
jgi:ribonuclease D